MQAVTWLDYDVWIEASVTWGIWILSCGASILVLLLLYGATATLVHHS
jgi:hypothetical protein